MPHTLPSETVTAIVFTTTTVDPQKVREWLEDRIDLYPIATIVRGPTAYVIVDPQVSQRQLQAVTGKQRFGKKTVNLSIGMYTFPEVQID